MTWLVYCAFCGTFSHDGARPDVCPRCRGYYIDVTR